MNNAIGSVGRQAQALAAGKLKAYQPEQKAAAKKGALPVDDLPLEGPKNQLQRETSSPDALLDLQESDRASQGDPASGHPEGGDSPAAPGAPAMMGEASEAGRPTPEQIAERVYELFRRDLRVYQDRKGS